jgi:hypothetical protein
MIYLADHLIYLNHLSRVYIIYILAKFVIKIHKSSPLLLEKSIKNTQIYNVTSFKKSINCTQIKI